MERVVGILLAILWFNSAVAADLPKLHIDQDRIVATGVSSGGLMAVQLGVAHSSVFRGIGVFAGGIYGCADKYITRSENCLTEPENPKSDVRGYLAFKHSRQLIDPPAGIARQKIYLFSGTEDKIVQLATMRSLAKFYELFVAAPNLKFDIVKSGHGQPTIQPGNECTSSSSPWLINCGINGAQTALEHIFGPLNSPVTASPASLIAFDQSIYSTPAATLSKQGLVYIPKKCQEGSACGLIVALHGCGQSPDSIGPVYATKAGYNEVADANDFVVLYPAVHPGWVINSAGCWDWWGYTGERMADQQGPQISAIMKMVNRLVGR